MSEDIGDRAFSYIALQLRASSPSDAWCASKLFSVRHELWELKDERDHRPIARGGKRGGDL